MAARSLEDERCCVKEGSLVRIGTPELELVWFSNEPLPIQLMPPKNSEFGATLLSVLEDTKLNNKSPLKLLRARDVVRTVWLPGASMPCAANKLTFAAILRAVMEGGDRENPLVLTFGPPPSQPWESSPQKEAHKPIKSPNPSSLLSPVTPSSSSSPRTNTTAPNSSGSIIEDPLSKALHLKASLTGWLSDAGANLEKVAEKMDRNIAESTETWQKVVSPGWLNPEPTMKADKDLRSRRRKEEQEKRESSPRSGTKAARAAEMRRQRLERQALTASMQQERKERLADKADQDQEDINLNGQDDNKRAKQDLSMNPRKLKAMSHLLVKWVNNAMCKDEEDPPFVRFLDKDMRSGVVLYQLCERLSQTSLSSYGKLVQPPTGQTFVKNISSLSNFFSVFRFLRDHFHLPDHDDDLSSEVVNGVIDGDMTTTVNLVWLIAVLFTSKQLNLSVEAKSVLPAQPTSVAASTVTTADTAGNDANMAAAENEDVQLGMSNDRSSSSEEKKEPLDKLEDVPINDEDEEEEDDDDDENEFSTVAIALDSHKRQIRRYLMAWCRHKLSPFQHIKINGLGKPSFKDGRAILALVSSHNPTACPYTPVSIGEMDQSESNLSASSQNYSAAMHAAKALYGCKLAFSPNTDTDFLLDECASEVLLLLVAGFKACFPSTDFSMNEGVTIAGDDDGEDEEEDTLPQDSTQDDEERENNIEKRLFEDKEKADVKKLIEKSEYVHVVVTLVGATGVPMRCNAKAAVRVGSLRSAWHATQTTHHNPCPQWKHTITSLVKLTQLEKKELYRQVDKQDVTRKSQGDSGGGGGGSGGGGKEDSSVSDDDDDEIDDGKGVKYMGSALVLPIWVKVYAVSDNDDDLLLAQLETNFELSIKPSLNKENSSNDDDDDDEGHHMVEEGSIWPPAQVCCEAASFDMKDSLAKTSSALKSPVIGGAKSSSVKKKGGKVDNSRDSDDTISDSEEEDSESSDSENDNSGKTQPSSIKKSQFTSSSSNSGISLQLSVTVLDIGVLPHWIENQKGGDFTLQEYNDLKHNLKREQEKELRASRLKMEALESENAKMKKAVGRVAMLAEENAKLKMKLKEIMCDKP